MLEEKIKEIVATYTKVPYDLINDQTVIDRSVITSSILVHRMYARLAEEGFPVDNYWGIKTYADLLRRLNSNDEVHPHFTREAVALTLVDLNEGNTSNSIGIDVEEISLMPQAFDYREDHFYTMNFSSSEIAYCILQANPVASFAGLFAAKEAIVKADNTYINRPFNSINIDHLPGGKPVHPHFQISISHTSTMAIGIAQKDSRYSTSQNLSFRPSTLAGNHKSIFFLYLLCIIAIITSLVAIILHFN